MLFLMVVLIGVSSRISRADDSTLPTIQLTPEISDRTSFHVSRYISNRPLQFLGLVNGNILASFSGTEHAWFFKNAFAPVNGADPAKALGYAIMQKADSFRVIPKKSPCEKYKDAISAVTISATKTLCLSSTAGGDFSLRLLPATKDKPISIGFGKQPILEKTRVSWIGYDGNLYIAYLHPRFFADEVTAVKAKTSPTVFFIRNNQRYSVPTEEVFYTWFDSFKPVLVQDVKKFAKYPVQAKAGYRANTLIQFGNDPEVYVYQPANDPNLAYGKDVKILTDKPEKWILQDPKNKKLTIELLKRPELLRHITAADVENTFGPSWNKQIIKLDVSLKAKYKISDKAFVPSTDIVYE
ncbi:hypothetical protein A3E97_03095 [Candidatus Uhrbacteria bacterium RIFCSPHIGHO2_12_FULL_47_12]|nr:MAG: hypothetical protein A2839_03575 [Candidatus Uhrbacteria bacterium RIFCSPHIGHO2_01_FULL_47_10]OGL76190.1 MAG: hypothetical protein A3E97_03095 [Candidatus Uhrbacteria bacterium RIFCSPHIGHO2_12_FULL_47_12]OGL92734.1 MAG: hypothetical protein A3H12_03645 [Candidatus Uhrbacteria bacterium RIFCSPLOWO2_12_FULL_47_9]